jgi:hypothetical protein
MSPRARARILASLETVYREAYNRAKEAGDKHRMLDLDAGYQREQILLEVLLDIRDALLSSASGATMKTAMQKLETIHKLTKLKGG